VSGQLSFLPAIIEPPTGTSDEWYTPPEVYDPLNAEFRFTVDACATAESAKCPRFYTELQDGLVQDYAGEMVWNNPPYSDIPPWVDLAWEQLRRGARGWVQLLPAWTDRKWWQRHVEPYRDLPAGAVRTNPAWHFRPDSRPWATLETRFLPRVTFGYPGNPTGRGGEQAKIYPVVLVWRRATG
jgi:phage N-6-adenine-methyltransferase